MAEERAWGQGAGKNLPCYNIWGKKNGRKTGKRAESSRVVKKQNTLFYLKFKIYKAAWPKAAIQLNKIYGLIILELSSAKKANLVIKKGLVEKYDIKTCELFDRSCRII